MHHFNAANCNFHCNSNGVVVEPQLCDSRGSWNAIDDVYYSHILLRVIQNRQESFLLLLGVRADPGATAAFAVGSRYPTQSETLMQVLVLALADHLLLWGSRVRSQSSAVDILFGTFSARAAEHKDWTSFVAGIRAATSASLSASFYTPLQGPALPRALKP